MAWSGGDEHIRVESDVCIYVLRDIHVCMYMCVYIREGFVRVHMRRGRGQR